MDHGKKKMGHGGMMMMKPKREKAAMGRNRSMYMEGGKAHSGAQPTYGSTVADAMPKGMAN